MAFPIDFSLLYIRTSWLQKQRTMSVLSKISSFAQECFSEFSKWDFYQNLCQHKWTIIAGFFGSFIVYQIITWPRNLPPGPRGLPFIGALRELSEDFPVDLLRFSKEHNSDVVSLYIGRQLTVSLNSADAIREAFLKSEDFSDRGEFGSIFDLQDQTITNTKYNEKWRRLKTFIMSSMRTHGFGSQRSEENITLQLDRMVHIFEAKKGAPIANKEMEEIFTKAAACVLMKMVADQSYEFDDPELLDLLERISGYQKIFFDDGFVLFVLMEILPGWFIRLLYPGIFKRCRESAAGIRAVLMRHIDEHRETLNERNPRDHLDDNIIQFANDPNFTDRMIADTIIVILPDATETLGSQFFWILFHLCFNPEYQDKCVQEMSSVCGANIPALKDRGKLLLCEAVILEGMRLSSQAGISFAHFCSKDVKFRGYTIPKGTSLQGNLYAVHHDEKLFPEPRKFKPERFIGNGTLINTEYVVPFGLGRRKCIGEPLTRAQFFIYLTGLLRHFKIRFADGHRPTTDEGVGSFRRVPECKLTFTPR